MIIHSDGINVLLETSMTSQEKCALQSIIALIKQTCLFLILCLIFLSELLIIGWKCDVWNEKSLCRVPEHLEVHAIDLVKSANLLLVEFSKVSLRCIVLPLDLENMGIEITPDVNNFQDGKLKRIYKKGLFC